jgi:inner membrane protein
MASLGHIAVGMMAGRAWARRHSGLGAKPAMLAFSVLSLLPDADVLGMALGVPYGAAWGHRGATHSLAIAALLGVGAAFVLARPRGSARSPESGAKRRRGSRDTDARASSPRPTAGMVLLAVAVAMSHGLLDAMTDGGKGVALFWPFSLRRFFLPWRPIPVAPIGLGLLSREGLEVALWELVVFSPLLAFALWPRPQSLRRR